LQKGLRSAGGLKLLKWGLPGRGVKSAKVRPTPYAYTTGVVFSSRVESEGTHQICPLAL